MHRPGSDDDDPQIDFSEGDLIDWKWFDTKGSIQPRFWFGEGLSVSAPPSLAKTCAPLTLHSRIVPSTRLFHTATFLSRRRTNPTRPHSSRPMSFSLTRPQAARTSRKEGHSTIVYSPSQSPSQTAAKQQGKKSSSCMLLSRNTKAQATSKRQNTSCVGLQNCLCSLVRRERPSLRFGIKISRDGIGKGRRG